MSGQSAGATAKAAVERPVKKGAGAISTRRMFAFTRAISSRMAKGLVM